MILSSQAVSALLRATDKAIPEQGDADLSVPSVLLLAMQPILPLDVLTSSLAVNFNSFCSEAQINLGTSGASSQLLCTLGAGLWDLAIDWASTTTGYAIYENFFLSLDYQGFSLRLVGSQNISNQPRLIQYKNRFLLRETAGISLRWGAIPGASVLTSNLGIVCNRLL